MDEVVHHEHLEIGLDAAERHLLSQLNVIAIAFIVILCIDLLCQMRLTSEGGFERLGRVDRDPFIAL